MKITVEAFSRYILRHVSQAPDAKTTAAIEWISSKPPRTFHEALQLVWFTHMAFVSEGRYDNALGRIDQYLLPFYKRDIEANLTNREEARNLFCHLFAHIEEHGEVLIPGLIETGIPAEIDRDHCMVGCIETMLAGRQQTWMVIKKAPKYGNGEPYVDNIAAWVVKLISDEYLLHRTIDNGRFVAGMAANISNIAAGKEVGATPDGRLAATPHSDATSPFFGRDTKWPTAFLRSVATPNYTPVLSGSVINMKFEPDFFQEEEGATRFGAITRFFVHNRIQELQFNFTGTKTLMDAQANPEDYANLVLRVSGFSGYFTRLSPDVQEDIIRRKSHGASA